MTTPDIRRKGRSSRGLYAAFAAISFHLMALVVWGHYRVSPPKKPAANITPITSEAARTALSRSRAARKEIARRTEEKKRPPESKLTGPVVEIDQATKRPDAVARFAAEHDASTEHETRARTRAKVFTPKARPTPPTSPREVTAPKDASAQISGGLTETHSSNRTSTPATADVKLRSVVESPRSGPRAAREPDAATHSSVGPSQSASPQPAPPKEASARALSLEDLIPDRQALAGLAGGAAPDVLNDMDVGDETRLNAAQFRYASFFNRVKRSVSGHWRAMEEHNRRDPSGRLYGVTSRQTVLAIVLDESGALIEALITQSSGIDFLDAAAVRAFRESQPFSNPPRALLDETKKVRFNFLFQLTFDGRYAY